MLGDFASNQAFTSAFLCACFRSRLSYEMTFDTRGLRDELALGKPTASIFPELQQQLGLRLEPAKEVMPIIAIDRLTKPTPN
jgi:uncharacterized protein (TIGR03435 family)